MKHLRIKVTGKVQGVFYRKSTQLKATELGLNVTVQNRNDGSVLIQAEGDPDALKALVSWCEQGPEQAEVAKVDVWEERPMGFEDFQIVY